MDHHGITTSSEGKVEAAIQHSPPPVPLHTPHPLQQLQHALGNRAFGRFIQAKLNVSSPGDQYEQEADRIADQVMGMPDAQPGEGNSLPGLSVGPAHLQRACSQCEEEEEEHAIQRSPAAESDELELQARSETGSVIKDTAPLAAQINNLSSGGAPLPESTRAFFEPRFGHDFSRVRVHTDAEAASSATSLKALAYTMGPHIVFQSGRYEPNTIAGRSLLAHELTHVIQQEGPARNSGPSRFIQCMSLGTGTPPTWSGVTLSVVPAEDLRRVNEAISLIQAVVNDPRGRDDCHNYFARHCPGGSANSMPNAFARAVIWKLHDPDGNLARGEAPGTNIGYTQAGYDQGTEALASTIVHEMLHNCGIGGDSEHYLADVAGLYCMGSDRNQFGFQFGPTLGGGFPFVMLLTYRRFLTEWASGRIQPTLGVDLNLMGLVNEAVPQHGAAEYGSALLGFHGRTNLLWGGERFGGFTARAEIGLGAARFSTRAPTPTEVPGTAVYPGFVLQLGVGAEFYIPTGGGRVQPLTLDAAYRMIQPLNQDAERIHALMFGVGF